MELPNIGWKVTFFCHIEVTSENDLVLPPKNIRVRIFLLRLRIRAYLHYLHRTSEVPLTRYVLRNRINYRNFNSCFDLLPESNLSPKFLRRKLFQSPTYIPWENW